MSRRSRPRLRPGAEAGDRLVPEEGLHAELGLARHPCRGPRANAVRTALPLVSIVPTLHWRTYSRAHISFAKQVEATDVSEAVSLVRAALQQAATDPRTGLVDLDLITTGQSAAARRRIGDLGKAVTDLLSKRKSRSVTFNVLQKELSEAAGAVRAMSVGHVFPPPHLAAA